MAVGSEAREQMHQEVERTAMTGVLDLANVLELIIDALDNRPFAQQQFVGQRQEHIAHILAQLGDEMKSLQDQEVFGQCLGDIAFIAEKLAKEATYQAGNRLTVVGVARSETEGQQLAPVVHDQMEFEAVKPTHRGFAAARVGAKDPMLVDARGMADGERGRVDEADAAAAALSALGVQIDREREHDSGEQLNEAIVADEVRELGAQMYLHMLGIEGFERAVTGLLKEDGDGHDLTGMEPRPPFPPPWAGWLAARSSRSHNGSKTRQNASNASTEQNRSSILMLIPPLGTDGSW